MMIDSEERGREAAVEGIANEHIAAGILMKRYHNVSLVDLPLSTYDLIIVLKSKDGAEDIIRAQTKTAKTNVRFLGGTRGGVDRKYVSGVKEYIQSTVTSDIVIGVHPKDEEAFDLYFVPSSLIEELGQKSISLNKIQPLKNNYFILENCKNKKLILEECRKLGII